MQQSANDQVQPDRLIRLPELLAMTSLSRASVYRRLSSDCDFPKPIKIGNSNARNSAVGFSFTETQNWIDQQAKKRGN